MFQRNLDQKKCQFFSKQIVRIRKLLSLLIKKFEKIDPEDADDLEGEGTCCDNPCINRFTHFIEKHGCWLCITSSAISSGTLIGFWIEYMMDNEPVFECLRSPCCGWGGRKTKPWRVSGEIDRDTKAAH